MISSKTHMAVALPTPPAKAAKEAASRARAKGGAKRHRDWPPRGEPIVFVDCPDPDNFDDGDRRCGESAAGLHGRVVLTGDYRPANFGVASRPFSVRTCARAADEVDVAGDSSWRLRATAAHLRSPRAHGRVAGLRPKFRAENLRRRRPPPTRRSPTPSTCTSFCLEGATSASPTRASSPSRRIARSWLIWMRRMTGVPRYGRCWRRALMTSCRSRVSSRTWMVRSSASSAGRSRRSRQLCDDDAFRDKVLNVSHGLRVG